MNKSQRAELQRMARDYLQRLKNVANKHGLGDWIKEIIKANNRGECVATEKEVELLSRMCDDERTTREEITKELGVSYRRCVDKDYFGKIKKLKSVGRYSKVSLMLFRKDKDYEC